MRFLIGSLSVFVFITNTFASNEAPKPPTFTITSSSSYFSVMSSQDYHTNQISQLMSNLRNSPADTNFDHIRSMAHQYSYQTQAIQKSNEKEEKEFHIRYNAIGTQPISSHPQEDYIKLFKETYPLSKTLSQVDQMASQFDVRELKQTLSSWNQDEIRIKNQKDIFQEIKNYSDFSIQISSYSKPDEYHEQAKASFQEGLFSLKEASEKASHNESFSDELGHAQFSLGLAKNILDLGLSFTPGVSVGKDAYEALSGKNLVTGEELSLTERSFAVLGVVSLGTSKPLQALAQFEKIAHAIDKTCKYTAAVVETRRILSYSRVIEKYSPVIQKGPLHFIDAGESMKVAETFRSATYFQLEVIKPVSFYRAFTHEGGHLRSYWSSIKPTGTYQFTLDAALSPEFKNTAHRLAELKVPQGTIIYQGVACPIVIMNKSIPVGSLMGGGDQVYIGYEEIQKLSRFIQEIGY